MQENEVFLLLIETSTDICSVAISRQFEILSEVVDDSGERRHAALLPNMIDKVLLSANIKLNEVDAIAFSKGPGSYTGLRVGLSTAKGLCMVCNIPIIGVSTLAALAYSTPAINQFSYFVPMIDAGRQEVYHAVFDADYKIVNPANPLILQASSLDHLLDQGHTLILSGDGITKAKIILNPSDSLVYGSNKMLANYMMTPALNKFLTSDFEDLAYTVPDYLKAPTYKKNLLSS